MTALYILGIAVVSIALGLTAALIVWCVAFVASLYFSLLRGAPLKIVPRTTNPTPGAPQ